MIDAGLLLLRLFLGLLVIGHALQKAAGWFHGPGLDAVSTLFDQWGFRPGRAMAALAAGCEMVAGVSLIFGIATPMGACILIGTMIVACAPNAGNGLWAARGGIELPATYGLLGAVIALTGPGALSLDYALGWHGPFWAGPAAIVFGVVASAVPLARRARTRPARRTR